MDERIEGGRGVPAPELGPFVVEVADHRGPPDSVYWVRTAFQGTALGAAKRQAENLVRTGGDRWCIRVVGPDGLVQASWSSGACRSGW